MVCAFSLVIVSVFGFRKYFWFSQFCNFVPYSGKSSYGANIFRIKLQDAKI